MAKFKVGDKVRKINGNLFFDGDEFKTVVKVEKSIKNSESCYRLKDSHCIWFEYELEMYEQKESVCIIPDSTICRENDNFVRVGSKRGLTLKFNGKSVFTKRKSLPVNRVSKIYNNKNELIGVDIVEETRDETDVIHNVATGLTIVIIHFENKKFKGIAKCHEDDAYVSQIGFQIAHARALKKKCDYLISKFTEGLNE